MYAILMAGLIYGAVADDPLIERLDAEFNSMVTDDPHATELKEAADLLEGTNQSSRWGDYSRATAILRKIRSKAAIPLLLKYMILHAEFSTSHVTLPEYARTISLITGEDISPPAIRSTTERAKIAREHVDKLLNEWWIPKKDKITTAPDKMSTEQLNIMIDGLLKKIARGRDYDSPYKQDPTAYNIYHILYYKIMSRSSSSYDRQPWNDEELDVAMVPLLLARAGYREDGKVSPPVTRVPYAVIELLAALRKNNELPVLDAIADDEKLDSISRLSCTLALYKAGEKLKTPVLLSILEEEKRLGPRLVAIIALRHAQETENISPLLIELLNDPNAEIQTAAVCALRGPKPPDAVPKLKEMIDSMEPPGSMVFIFDLIGEIGTGEAKHALADFMRAAMSDSRKARRISDALDGFETATGQRWRSAGAHDNDYYSSKAREALVWWDAQLESQRPPMLTELAPQIKTRDRDGDGIIDLRRSSYSYEDARYLECIETLDTVGVPERVANYVYHKQHLVYADFVPAGAAQPALVRSYPHSAVHVETLVDPAANTRYLQLTRRDGTTAAIFERDNMGRLKPLDRSELKLVTDRFASDGKQIDQLQALETSDPAP